MQVLRRDWRHRGPFCKDQGEVRRVRRRGGQLGADPGHQGPRRQGPMWDKREVSIHLATLWGVRSVAMFSKTYLTCSFVHLADTAGYCAAQLVTGTSKRKENITTEWTPQSVFVRSNNSTNKTKLHLPFLYSSICTTSCNSIGRVSGQCNADHTDCDCSDEKVKINESQQNIYKSTGITRRLGLG